MRRFLRYLRIAFSVTCVIACVLLMALWVRSYSQQDDVVCGIVHGPALKIISLKGELGAWRYESYNGGVTMRCYHRTMPVEGLSPLRESAPSNFLMFSFHISRGRLELPYMLVMPQWFIVVLTAVLGATPWVRWSKLRFSLRMLLIATTLVAVVLGLIVWAVR